MPFFSKVLKKKDGSRTGNKSGKNADGSDANAPLKPRWEDAWARKDVAPEEIQELIHVCTQEMKSRALDMPFLLLPFRPSSDPGSARGFIRSFFKADMDGGSAKTGLVLQQELRLTEPMVLCSIMKWCWSRLPGGVVTWEVYEMFKIGEQDSHMARHAFDTFIPISADSEARKQIIFDYFDLLAAIAARGKANGLGGRKLSRMAGWWAFQHSDDGNGFEGGYRSWANAADAASHMFFGYLRSLSSDQSTLSGINTLPRSLESLLSQTEYPPETPTLMHNTTPKVVMIVNSVSPTPQALLRRAKHFHYRDDDQTLQEFSAYEDPLDALTDECRRVLNCVASANQTVAVKEAGVPDATWSRFEDSGFSGLLDFDASSANGSTNGSMQTLQGMRAAANARTNDFGRPTTPSWADFLSTGFNDQQGQGGRAPLLLPPDKILPNPLGDPARVKSSQSHLRNGHVEEDLEPGELASISQLELDETFWWVWMTSLASEETAERKAVFGRCALVETEIQGARWLVMEEQVKGAAAGPEEGAYIAEKKGIFSFTRRGRLGRRKSTGKKIPAAEPYDRNATATSMSSKSALNPNQAAKFQAAVAELAQQQMPPISGVRRGRMDDAVSTKTNSVLTLQPVIASEALPAMKWAKEFDKDAIKARYLADTNAGKGKSVSNLVEPSKELSVPAGRNGAVSPAMTDRDLPALPKEEPSPQATTGKDQKLPPAPLPPPPNPQAYVYKNQGPSAAHIPLPEAISAKGTPAKGTTAANVQRLAPPDLSEQHPALRNQPHEQTERVLSPEPQQSSLPVVETDAAPTKKSAPNKLKKGGHGFKKLFGRKKADSARSETPQPTEPQAIPYTPRESVEKSATEHVPVHEPRASNLTVDTATKPVVSHSPDVAESPAVSAMSEHTFQDNRGPVSPVSTMAPQDHHRENFGRFDQGPLQDIPAFIPEDSDEDSAATPQASRFPNAVTPPNQSQGQSHQASDDVSEASVDLTRQTSPSQDRWAQIRKNAAERAARLSEEQSRRSHSQSFRTDDGETSGEETIESRVARIKARVAELTGNMDAQGNIPLPNKR